MEKESSGLAFAENVSCSPRLLLDRYETIITV